MNRSLSLTAALAAATLAISAAPAAAAPSNDAFAQATPLTVPATVTTDLAGVTREAGEPAHGQRTDLRSAWYVFRPTTGERVDVALARPTGELPETIAVYTGSGLNDLQPVGASINQDHAFARVAFDVVAGRSYCIALDRKSVV